MLKKINEKIKSGAYDKEFNRKKQLSKILDKKDLHNPMIGKVQK